MRDLGITPQSSAVVTAIIALARSLGLRVIAEGVENLRQMEVLHRLGCGVMQGFLFSRPIPPDDLEQLAARQTVLPRRAPWIGQANALEASETQRRLSPARGVTAAERLRRLPRARRRPASTRRPLIARFMRHAARSRRALGRSLPSSRRRRRSPRRRCGGWRCSKLEPTPENFARAYAQEAGQPASERACRRVRGRWCERMAARAGGRCGHARGDDAGAVRGPLDDLQRALERAGAQTQAQAAAWVSLIERIARGLERGGRHWTGARKKQSLQRVLDGSRNDAARLQQRLDHLLSSWDDDRPDGEVEPTAPAPLDMPPAAEPPAGDDAAGRAGLAGRPARTPATSLERDVVRELGATLQSALPSDGRRAGRRAGRRGRRIARDGATPALVQEVATLCERARLVLTHRRHLADELGSLCRELTDSLGELAEDESWARGQVE